jgi:CheY-like chemotaxis protein
MSNYDSFRRREIPQPEIVYDISDADESAQPPTQSKKVLILEDDGDFATMLKDTLQFEGYQITIVTNGADGLKKIMAGEFDVILCDMVMQNFPGDMFYLAVERIRPEQCKRFIFMTGHKGDHKIEQFINNIHGLMLWKPFEMHDLHAAIHAKLGKNQA